MDFKKSYKTLDLKLSSTFERISNKFFFFLLVFYVIGKMALFHTNFYKLSLDEWHSQELTMDYSYGFIRRGLLGTFATFIKMIFNIDYPAALKTVQCIGVILFTIAVLLFFYSLLKDKTEKSFCLITLIYISLDHIGFELNLFGLLDTYIMALTLLMVYLIVKDKCLFLIPVLSGICILIHEAYPMMFFGIIVALLIYRFCYAEDKSTKRRYVIVFGLTSLIVSCLFVFFYFIHPRIDNPDIPAILANSRIKLGGYFESSNLQELWISKDAIPGSKHAKGSMWLDGLPTYWFYFFIAIFFINTLVCFPLLSYIKTFWKEAISSQTSKSKKILLFLCSISVFLITPLIIFHVDHGRWFYGIVFHEIVVIGSIFLINSNNERNILFRLSKYNIPKAFLILFYMFFYFQIIPGQLNFISLFCDFFPFFSVINEYTNLSI